MVSVQMLKVEHECMQLLDQTISFYTSCALQKAIAVIHGVCSVRLKKLSLY